MKNETARREIESLDYYLQNHTNDYSEESHTAMMMAIDALSNSEKPDKWIPVSERLPKDDGLYLVYTEEQPFVCPFEDGEFFIDEVLAWMPLPSPYQPQERSEE